MINQGAKPGTLDADWKMLYQVGGTAALAAVLVYLLDTSLTFTGNGTEPGVRTTVEWFTLMQDNLLFELRNLGFLNILAMVFGIPVYSALYVAHRRIYPASAALPALLFFIGAAIYISNNPSIPMAVLSSKYAAATTDAQRSLLAAAGETLLAQGEDFTPGFFVGFIFGEFAGLAISLVMLRGRVFSQVNAWIGILAFSLLILFTVWSTFIPVFFDVAMIFAMTGGLSGLIWYILTARKLFQLGQGAGGEEYHSDVVRGG